MEKEFKNSFYNRISTSVFLIVLIFSIILLEKFWLFYTSILLLSILSLSEWLTNDKDKKGWFYKNWFLNLKGPLGLLARILSFILIFIVPIYLDIIEPITIITFLVLTLYLSRKSINIIIDKHHKKNISFENHSFGLALIFNFYLGSIIYVIANSSFDPISRYYVFLYIIMNTAIFDTFAYLIGSKFGQNFIFSDISPKKTLEGLLGGFFAVAIYSFLTCSFIDYFYYGEISNYIYLIIFVSIIGGFFAFTGDLLISYLKRGSGVKDTGKILPGHGGILDRIDSHLIATPIMILLFIILLSFINL